MPVEEESAGVVVFRVDPAGVRMYLLLDYGHHWDFPKGHLEKGETPLEAAQRELKEETGISRVELLPNFAARISYFFREKRKRAKDKTPVLVHKTVTFFAGRVDSEVVKLSDEHVGFEFLPFEQAVNRLTYPTARQVLRQVETALLKAP
jgi:bis(5'-nucleosidyl)-tetraphosphatase